MKAQQAHVVLLDNHDSFVYNLVDAFAVAGYHSQSYTIASQ
ncbi:hypothetical protein CIP107534_02351 [Corynebacterium diphtheriae]|nr:hypothetical protein CIP107534_02351 [Corynebacterium diphtheriae]